MMNLISALHRDETGAEQLAYLLIVALVILPLWLVVRLLWAVLLRYHYIGALIVDMPLF